VQDFEWVVVLNGGAKWNPPDDPRVWVTTAALNGVGAAKERACACCHGEILVELDHDDILASTCLEEIGRAFDIHPGASMVYSETAQITAGGKKDTSKFDTSHGWEYYEDTVDGRAVMPFRSMEPTPHNVSYIWYAPNHVKGISHLAYDTAGGYDPARYICDDQDLMCRLYQVGPFVPIHKCLYLQRVHGQNTQTQRNADIQAETVKLYDYYIQPNVLSWCKREGLIALDFGAAHNQVEGYIGVDQREGPGVDIVAELPKPIDLPDSSVGVIRACDFLEHIADKVGLINEIYRLLAPGGMLLSLTPSTDGRGAFQDPTHVAFYNENSFWYYTQASMQKYVPDLKCHFQVSRLFSGYPSAWHEQHQISYVTANLIALKEPMPRQGGRVEI